MAFTDYKSVDQVQEEYSIEYRESAFLNYIEEVPSVKLLEEFDFNRENIDVTASEESRCEHIIMPVLREIYKRHFEKYSFWSHKFIQADEKLRGTPDYIFSNRSKLGKTVLEFPLIIIAEAKKNDFGAGWGQCLAELVAAQKLNNSKDKPVYGIVTDGEVWQFGNLTGSTFTKETNILKLNELPELLGTLDYLLETGKEIWLKKDFMQKSSS
ncbi:MAG: hypothetical protein GY795_18850 [Desulfobacterales bacterium]|nr:hypothetical protein [Desulfobacterales bacterium]